MEEGHCPADSNFNSKWCFSLSWFSELPLYSFCLATRGMHLPFISSWLTVTFRQEIATAGNSHFCLPCLPQVRWNYIKGVYSLRSLELRLEALGFLTCHGTANTGFFIDKISHAFLKGIQVSETWKYMKVISESTCVMTRCSKMAFIKAILLCYNLQCHCHWDTIDVCSA